MTHDELQEKYNIKTNHIVTLQIYSSLPNNWIKSLKKRIYSTPLANIQNNIYINKSKLKVEKVKYKEYYWHLIKTFAPLDYGYLGVYIKKCKVTGNPTLFVA